MSLDEPRNAKHAALAESDDHPGWLEVARRQEAAEAAAREREYREQVAFESIEAEEARASYQMQRRAIEIPQVVYARD